MANAVVLCANPVKNSLRQLPRQLHNVRKTILGKRISMAAAIANSAANPVSVSRFVYFSIGVLCSIFVYQKNGMSFSCDQSCDKAHRFVEL